MSEKLSEFTPYLRLKKVRCDENQNSYCYELHIATNTGSDEYRFKNAVYELRKETNDLVQIVQRGAKWRLNVTVYIEEVPGATALDENWFCHCLKIGKSECADDTDKLRFYADKLSVTIISADTGGITGGKTTLIYEDPDPEEDKGEIV